MRSRLTTIPALAMVAMVAVSATACGSDPVSPEGEDPQRAVDPRVEALRFFPADTEIVTLTRVVEPVPLLELDSSISAFVPWQEQRDRLEVALKKAGIDPSEILDLARSPQADLELPEPEIAAGPVPGSGSSADRMLYVLATDRGAALDRMFVTAEEAETGLIGAGELDDARLYRVEGEELTVAIRDGVIVAAVGLDRLQQAIMRRDGDREGQLDEAAVNGLLNRLPEGGLFHAYIAAGEESAALVDLAFGELETDAGQAVAADDAGLTAGPRDTGNKAGIDVLVELDGRPGTAGREDPPTAEEPAVIPVTATDLVPIFGTRVAAELAAEEPVIALAAWIDADRARIRAETGSE